MHTPTSRREVLKDKPFNRNREEEHLEHNSPNIHTSLAEVNLLKLIDSGAIHLMGSLPFEAGKKDLYSIDQSAAFKIIRIESLRVSAFTFIVGAVLHVSGQAKVSEHHTVN